MKLLRYFIITFVSCLIIIFIFRLAYSAQFDNVITDTDYWEYNINDNQINNLNDINITSKSFLNVLRGFPNYFTSTVEGLTKFNVFDSMIEDTKDIFLIGEFINFMSNVYTFVVYIISIVISLLQIVIDIVKFVFTVEAVDITTTTISIADVG